MTPTPQTAPPKGLVIAAPNSNTGKTVFTMGLVAAFRSRGLNVQVAKAGPGYIDPQFLTSANQAACHNLDLWASGANQVRARASEVSALHDVFLIEGMMGMFDGAASIKGSTADLAATLNLPVLLLVDASGQAQSIAALVHGFATLRSTPKVCGVVATQVGSDGHAAMLKEALKETGIPFFGSVKRSEDLVVPSRHLGLVQAIEQEETTKLISAARDAVLAGVDLDAVLSHAGSFEKSDAPRRLPPLGQRIAIAKDVAFSFAYPHILEDWRAQGAELSFFSPLADERPRADCDAIYLPGGYPELHAEQLSHASDFRAALKEAAARNTVIYGECGGYMVLGRALTDANHKAHAMLGLLDHTTSFATRQMHIGYRELTPQRNALWKFPLRGHEFHWSVMEAPGTDAPLFQQTDARGEDLGLSGGCRGSVMGSYAHIIDRAPG